jgi:zinc transport system substrate-binding protein
MGRCAIPILLCALCLLGCGRGDDTSAGPERLEVLVTLGTQLEMVRAIGGERVQVTAMVPAGQSPHLYEPVPSTLRAAAAADVYFTVGSGVEFERSHLETIGQQNKDLTVVACAEGIPLRSIAEHEHGGHGDHGDHGDHGAGQGGTTDPHVWLAPANLTTMADHVLAGLIAADPAGEASYRSAHETYVLRLADLDGELRGQLTPYAGRPFLVYHPSWGYFADAYGLEQVAVEEGGRQPGPAGIAALIAQARRRSIGVVFASPQFDTTAAETIANEIDGRVVLADPLAEDVEGTLRTLTTALVQAFEAPDGR